MTERIEKAVLADFAIVKEILELPKSLDASEPQTQEEVDQWVQQAQKIRLRMIDLEKESRELRVETIGYLKSLKADTDCPLKDSVIEFFEAENAYFQLSQDAQEESTVVTIVSGSLSEEERRTFEAIAELGERLLASYDIMLKSQAQLVLKAKEQGLVLTPVWDPVEQKETLDSYRAMKTLAERFQSE